MELKEIKKIYMELAKKYKIPSFEDLNYDFEIDKLEKDTDHILRVIRKLMMEKIVNSINFLEMLLNPVNTPRMYLPYIRMMSLDDKKTMDKLYSELSDLTLLSLDLEIDSNEKSEAELIKKIFEKWNFLKPDFSKILVNMKQPKNFSSNKKERSYFG